MVPPKYTFFQCISKVFDIIIKYPFAFFLLALVIFTVFIVIYNKKIKSMAPKIIAILSWIIVAIFMIVKYFKAAVFLKDTLKSKTFTAIYFPNVITYICILLVSAFIIIRSFIKKESSMVIKVINTVSAGVIGVNFILILREIIKKNITIYDPVTIYQNGNLQVLIQTSTIIFMLWIIALIINYLAKIATKRMDKLAENNN